MTVQELIDKLQAVEDKNLKVAVYSQMDEASDMPERVQITKMEEAPYDKGDDVWIRYDLPSDEKVVYIL